MKSPKFNLSISKLLHWANHQIKIPTNILSYKLVWKYLLQTNHTAWSFPFSTWASHTVTARHAKAVHTLCVCLVTVVYKASLTQSHKFASRHKSNLHTPQPLSSHKFHFQFLNFTTTIHFPTSEKIMFPGAKASLAKMLISVNRIWLFINIVSKLYCWEEGQHSSVETPGTRIIKLLLQDY